MAKVAQQYLTVDPWKVVEEGFHPDRAEVSESIFAVANEYMGVRGYFEEGYSGPRMLGSYFNGVFEESDIAHPQMFRGLATRMTFLVNAVDWLYTRIELDGQTLDLAACKHRDFRRELDLATGQMNRSFVWQLDDGRETELSFQRIVSMDCPNLGYQRIAFRPLNFSGSVQVTMGLDASVEHIAEGRNLWKTLRRQAEGPAGAILARTLRSGHRVFSAYELSGPDGMAVDNVQGESFVGSRVTLDLTEGQAATVEKRVANRSDRDTARDDQAVWADGVAAMDRTTGLSYDDAFTRHAAYWKQLWDRLDVTIEGDPANQQGVRFCIFQLHQTYHGVDPSLNVGAKGLTGEFYWGCTWWDTETYCLPFYMFNNPAAARNLLGYRHRTLAGACDRAEQLDARGARYPMCTIDGQEVCGTWQHGDLEIHVSAAVAHGVWHYDRVVGDKEFLYGQGIEMLLQIARYYASRGDWAPNGDWGYWGVMGADEFHMMVHNNTYTNVMARRSMRFALEVLAEMAAEAPEKLAAVKRKVALADDEPADWQKKIDATRVLFDEQTGLIEQHDGYFDLPHVDVSAIPPEQFPIYKNWAYVRIFRYDMIKQPDVLLLPFFFSRSYDRRVKEANYDYYEPRCSHESSLSPSIHAILAAELGRLEQAYDYSLHAARLDLDDYNRNAHEGLHTTSMAAAWLNMVYGWGGLRSDGQRLSFTPAIPAAWTSFSFRILYAGSLLAVTVGRERVELKVIEGDPVTVELFEQPVEVTAEGHSAAMPAERIG